MLGALSLSRAVVDHSASQVSMLCPANTRLRTLTRTHIKKADMLKLFHALTPWRRPSNLLTATLCFDTTSLLPHNNGTKTSQQQQQHQQTLVVPRGVHQNFVSGQGPAKPQTAANRGAHVAPCSNLTPSHTATPAQHRAGGIWHTWHCLRHAAQPRTASGAVVTSTQPGALSSPEIPSAPPTPTHLRHARATHLLLVVPLLSLMSLLLIPFLLVLLVLLLLLPLLLVLHLIP